jgi:hypothetical protein
MDTPNADRFRDLLAVEHDILVNEAREQVIALSTALNKYQYTAEQRLLLRQEIDAYQSTIRYYSKGAENEDEFLTAEPAETPQATATANGITYHVIVTEDMCILGL